MAWGDAMPPDGSRTGYMLLLCVGAGESGRDPITEVFMATDDQSSPPPVRASKRDWERVTNNQAWSPALCLLELRDRVEALEAAGGVKVDFLPPISPAVWVGTPAGVAPQVVPPTSTVLTVDELADCLPANAWAGPEGYSRQAFARHLLDHPRIGPLLRGEGAPTSKRVVLSEGPPIIADCYDPLYGMGRRDAWAASRAEVERQQGGQADG